MQVSQVRWWVGVPVVRWRELRRRRTKTYFAGNCFFPRRRETVSLDDGDDERRLLFGWVRWEGKRGLAYVGYHCS